MIQLPDGTILIEQGEPLPAVCACGHAYPVPVDSEWSKCPKCGRDNIHEQLWTWSLIKGDEE